MPLLRLTQTQLPGNNYQVEIAFESEDGLRQTATVTFEFHLETQDRSDLRWYLEDYLQYPMEPAPMIAKRIEQRLDGIGSELFAKVFQHDADTLNLWFEIAKNLEQIRIEIATDVQGATALPWELLRDPRSRAFLALQAQSFVRSYSTPVKRPTLPKNSEKVRILLAICRPGGVIDVPFRSVAGKLLKGLPPEAAELFEFDVLRPPTFAQFTKQLCDAKAQGKPYHFVHFDGHGAYFDSQPDMLQKILASLGALMLTGPRTGKHGYLLFEHPEAEQNIELVDGLSLGKLLVETQVPVLVLNACRSAHAEFQENPTVDKDEDIHSQVRAFGSLAQEVMDAGVAGVVAMRYNVYVVTAAQFVADLYAALASGQTLGEAVSLGRKQLAAQPLREIAFEPRPLQDWSVPVVYEAAPIQLFPRVGATGGADIAAPLRIDISQAAKPADDLPRPDIGFFGRDETLLALDRAYDSQSIVLLHAYAGSGKTMTAAEFARWYAQTGGLDGPILFTSFETYKPLERVLDTVEQVFRQLLEANNIQWLAMDAETRLNITLQIFKQIPVLWIWDNVEPINGFPSGTNSAWTEAEQRELKMFLQIVTAQTRAKFLLTSRRDERSWLGDLPRRVSLPPMPMQEMVQLARALAEKQGRRITDVEDWRPLLNFTKGNPLTINVIVGQALRDGITTRAKIKDYVQKLRNGEAKFDDETSEFRTKSLGASLSYGFENAFNDDERKILALLYLFQGFVNTAVLRVMGQGDWALPELKNLTPDTQTLDTLLKNASEIGLITPHGGGYYTIHPALPWFFKSLFEQYYPQTEAAGRKTEAGSTSVIGPPSSVALRAFVQSLGELGNYYQAQYQYGNRDVIAPLRSEEANLLRARALALSGLRQSKGENIGASALIGAMQGLRTLYNHTGRRAEWQRLVDEIVPDFVGADDLPRPGRDGEQWGLVTEYRVRLAQEARDWPAAERLQRLQVDVQRRNAAALLARPPESLGANEKNTLRTLGASLHELGQIQRELGQPDCVQSYQESAAIFQNIGDNAAAAVAAFNLGNAYMGDEVPALRNLDLAEHWYRRSLELRAKDDSKGRANSMAQLGYVLKARFDDEKKSDNRKTELQKYLSESIDYYQQSLNLLPPDDVNARAVVHNQLGNIYGDAGEYEQSLHHHREAAKFHETAGNLYSAAQVQFNLAITSLRLQSISDALLYARAALRNFEPYGQGAAEMIEDTKGLIGWIEGKMGK